MTKKQSTKKFAPPPKSLAKKQNPKLLLFNSLEEDYHWFSEAYHELIKAKDGILFQDENSIIPTGISMLENPQKVAKELKKSPEKLIYEPLYQTVVWFLRSLCEREQNVKNKWARKLLREMGLELFIPDVPKRTTDHAYLFHYGKHPEKLKRDVVKYTREIHKHINL